MIDVGANFSLSGAPDYLVTVVLLYAAAVYLLKAMGRWSPPAVPGAIGKALSTAWATAKLLPVIVMVIACLALIAGTLPAALRMIGL
jgi:hypothetical protein